MNSALRSCGQMRLGHVCSQTVYNERIEKTGSGKEGIRRRIRMGMGTRIHNHSIYRHEDVSLNPLQENLLLIFQQNYRLDCLD